MIDTPSAFDRRVGILWVDDYEEMPIRPHYVSIFRRFELDGVLCFVAEHPQYHVISAFRETGVMVNRFDASADGWLLGDGDADPELVNVTTERYWRRAGEILREAFGARSSAKAG
jgi:hypothetical protein